MFRNLIVILAGGLLLANPLTAQECCDKDKAASKVASSDCDSKKDGCDSMAASSCCTSGTVASTVSQDEPTDLAKGLAGLAKKSFSFNVAVDAKDGPEATKVDAKLAFGDPKHFSVNVSLVSGAGEASQAVKLELVADGSFLYYHIDGEGAPPGMEYGKINISVFDEIIKQATKESPLAIFDDKGGVNASSIDKALSMSGMKIARDAEKGTLTLSLAEPVAEGQTGSNVVITLNGKTSLPISIEATEGEKSAVTANFTNVTVMKDLAAFGESAFKFSVPEGVNIMDLTQMVEMQMGAMGGMEDEEEELEF